MHDLIPVTALRAGQWAEVRQIVGHVDQIRRLEELGLRDGVRLEMVRCGSPCIVRLAGSTLCFRDEEALQVFVVPGNAA